MAVCLNKNSVEYQTLLKMSGLSEFKFNAFTSTFVDKFGRYPELDEIPGADSRPYLNNSLSVKTIDDTSFVKNDKIFSQTGTTDVKEANIRINNTYRDLEVKLTPSSEVSTIQVRKRPNKWDNVYEGGIIIDDSTSSSRNVGVFNSILEKLANLYGINFISITNGELSSEQWKGVVDDAKTTNAFVYNGNIYINIDNSSIDAPLHEMLHLFLGSVRYSDPQLYFSMVEAMNELPNKALLARNYKDRTDSDINEELLVLEFSKYVTGQDSIISKLPVNVLHKTFYNMGRVLDSILFGEQSIATMDTKSLFNSSLVKLSEYLGSALTNNQYSGTFNVKSAEVHRVLANVKSDLMKNKDLKEFCG
jgi:hypothetical protein|nr:MAG TPA: hypothetical protein [Caudoviricetes sp.]